MSGAATIERAAAGDLPDWACASDERRAHIGRVMALMDGWASALGLPAAERTRWRAAAALHDALRDAKPDALRPLVDATFRDLPGSALHGPAVAARLRGDGVRDEELLDAVTFHTLGSPRLTRLGRALYLADFLEPARPFRADWRADLRRRMPNEIDDVVVEVAASRITMAIERRVPVRPESVGFWNALVGERGGRGG